MVTFFELCKTIRALPSCLPIYVFLILTNCQESPDCVHFPPKTERQVPFIFIDKVTGENLLRDYRIENPKAIELDSLAVFNEDLVKFPHNQWLLDSYGPYGYAIYVYLFDQLQVPDVDVYAPGSITYYLYSGNSDYDTIVFNYSFERGKYCHSETNDILTCYINGKAAKFSSKGRIHDIYAIEK